MGVATGFSYGRDSTPAVSLHTGSAGTGSDYFCAFSEGCVLLHINDKDLRGSKKSPSYAHLFKKSRPHNTVCRSPKESSESKAGVWGGGLMSITKERNNPRFLSTKTRFCPILECSWSSPKPKISSRITMGLLLHKAGSTTALHSHLSPIVKPFSAAPTIGRVPPLGYQINQ